MRQPLYTQSVERWRTTKNILDSHKVEPLPSDSLEVIGPDGVAYVQQNFAWYFKLFDY